jgi:hypothetical protein
MGGPNSAVAKAIAELRNAVADSKTTPQQIQEKVSAVRTARQKAQGDLAAAQSEVRQIITPQQDAILIGLGYLE